MMERHWDAFSPTRNLFGPGVFVRRSNNLPLCLFLCQFLPANLGVFATRSWVRTARTRVLRTTCRIFNRTQRWTLDQKSHGSRPGGAICERAAAFGPLPFCLHVRRS